MHTTHYELLNIPYNATLDEVKRAYKFKLLTTHPDKLSSPDSNGADIAKIVEAYNTLSDATARASYDLQLHNSSKSAGYNLSGRGLDVYSLDDFRFVEDNNSFYKDCPRCELVDGFILSEQDLENGTSNDDGGFDIIAQCSSCSLWIQITYFESEE
ncbi:diphthamide biosynthesis protein 4 [Acetobacter pasteurianus]|nr:diphthamide biosynthesis protein 4 [Acetobacter pasteurianus]